MASDTTIARILAVVLSLCLCSSYFCMDLSSAALVDLLLLLYLFAIMIPFLLKTVLLFMIRFTGVDLERSVYLFEQHHPRELMRQGYPAEAHPEVCSLFYFV